MGIEFKSKIAFGNGKQTSFKVWLGIEVEGGLQNEHSYK